MTDYDPLYIAARGVLLDALEALDAHRDAIVVVGAQAVYLRTGDTGAASAPYTTDADVALAPKELADAPLLEELLRASGFTLEIQPGGWLKRVFIEGEPVDVELDIMVPEGLAPGGGRRSVRIDPHHKMTARKALGLEGTVVDNDLLAIVALDPGDVRTCTVRVAGPAALMVAKLHKLSDRLGSGKSDRIANKDAEDVFRLMQAIPWSDFAPRMQELLSDQRSQSSSAAALSTVQELFGAPASQGVAMAVESLRVAAPAETVRSVCTGFTRQIRESFTPPE